MFYIIRVNYFSCENDIYLNSDTEDIFDRFSKITKLYHINFFRIMHFNTTLTLVEQLLNKV